MVNNQKIVRCHSNFIGSSKTKDFNSQTGQKLQNKYPTDKSADTSKRNNFFGLSETFWNCSVSYRLGIKYKSGDTHSTCGCRCRIVVELWFWLETASVFFFRC